MAKIELKLITAINDKDYFYIDISCFFILAL